MNKLLSLKNLFAAALIAYGIWGNSLLDILDTPTPPPKPAVVNVDTPKEELISIVVPVSATVTDAEDRAKLAVFFLELSKTVATLPPTASLQNLNDILVQAATEVFNTSLHGKYDGLDEGIVRLITEATGTENHVLSSEEKLSLSKRCEALAWAFVQKG